MINDFFLDKCNYFLTNIKNENNKYNKVIDIISNVISWYKKENKYKDDIDITEKLDLTLYLIKLHNEYKNLDFANLIFCLNSGKFESFIGYIENLKDVNYTEEKEIEIINLIIKKKKISELIKNKESFVNLISTLDSGNFEDENDIIKDWEKLITKSWNRLSDVKKVELNDKVMSLDFLEDDYTKAEDSIRETYDFKNVIPTGYKKLDKIFPAGGFEKKRLITIGGTSNVGKSALMLNFVRNPIIYKNNQDDNNIDTYLIITGENLVDETLLRAYCIFTGEPQWDVINKIKFDKTFKLENKLRNYLRDRNSNIIVKYIRPGTASCYDIRNMVDEVKNSKYNLKMVVMDYIRLVRSTRMLDDVRQDLGQCAIDFKNIAVDYNIPFMTATQLNKSGYDKRLDADPTSIAEAMLVFDNSDVCLFYQTIQKCEFVEIVNIKGKEFRKTCTKRRLTLLKNRSGGKDKVVFLKTEDSITENMVDERDIFNYRIHEVTESNNIQEEGQILNF